METIKLARKHIYQGDLMLVNRDYPIQRFYYGNAKGLVPVGSQDEKILLLQRPAALLTQLLISCNAREDVAMVSGYRSLKEQTAIFESTIQEKGHRFAEKYVALPDCSEHQTGLAIDLAKKQETIDFICPDFPDTGRCGEVKGQAAKFGFVQRYPKEKENLTGISYEPWHFRYVGYPHSKIMAELDMILEEYVAFLKHYLYPERKFTFRESGMVINISYLSLLQEESVQIPRPAGLWQISGNNMDGAILTEWEV